jgi:hypothetical protein
VKDYLFWFDMPGEHIAGHSRRCRRIGYSGGFCSSGSPLREAREGFVEVHCRVKPGESATGNDDSGRFHAIGATCAIKTSLISAFAGFSPIFFSSVLALKFYKIFVFLAVS